MVERTFLLLRVIRSLLWIPFPFPSHILSFAFPTV